MPSLTPTLFSPDGQPLDPSVILSRLPPDISSSTIVINADEPRPHPEIHTIIHTLSPRAKHLILSSHCRSFLSAESVAWMQSYTNLNIFCTPFDHNSFTQHDVENFNAHYTQSLYGIRLLLEHNLRVAALIPFDSTMSMHLPQIVTGLDTIGLTNIILQFRPNTNQPTRYSDIHQDVRSAINSINTIIHVENVPPCMLGVEYDHHSNFLSQNPDTQTFTSTCNSCALRSTCPGVPEQYLTAFGDTELGAIRLSGEPLVMTNHDGNSDSPSTATHLAITTAFNLSHNPALTISPDEIERIIEYIPNHPSFWDLVERLGYPLPVLVKILEALNQEGIISLTGETATLLRRKPYSLPTPRDFSEQRLPSDPQFTQLRVSHHDLERRARYIIDRCPAGGSLAVLGDDDFMSLTIASTNHFSRVTVFEIDERIAKRIQEIATREKLNVEVVQHDLRKPLPSRFLCRFDAFYTDSPYSPLGIELFVSRGIQLLKEQPKLHGFASFSPEIPVMEDVELPVQEKLTAMGLYIEHKSLDAVNLVPQEIKTRFPNFNDLKQALDNAPAGLSDQEQWYLAALGRKEYLFHLLTTQKTKPGIVGECTGEIYYEKNPLTFYLDNLRWKEEHLPTKKDQEQ